MTLDLSTLARSLGGEISAGQVIAPGPGHSAADRSLAVKIAPDAPDGFIVFSHAGDDPLACKDYVREKAGLHKHEPRQHARAIAEYVYQKPDGTPFLRVLRYQPKRFLQQHWTGAGWEWGKPAGDPIPYRLPELLEAEHNTVFVCEGEKDADRLAALGLVATTNAGGSGKWRPVLNEWFRDRTVYVLPDNDEPGRQHADDVARNLNGVARDVRVVALPGLPDKGDVSDWLGRGRDVNELIKIAELAPIWSQEEEAPEPTPQLPWLNMSRWDHEPLPQRQWAIRDRVPLRQAGLFSGEGGTGKSIIELTKNVAHVAGKDWLGSLPEPGPAFYVGAEDDADEIHIRLAAIAAHYGVTFRELTDGGLHVLCLLGQDATLCAAGKSGKVETTTLYRSLYEAAGDIKPKNISVDTLSRAFAGSEIDRVQVYAFAMHMQALAMVANGSVTVLSHPSLSGISTGTGLSGSTAWHGAFRFRQYLRGVKPSDGEQPDSDLRELEFKKNQYGPLGEKIVLRYQHGLFLPEHGMTTIEKAADEAEAEHDFLEKLRAFTRQGRNVSASPNSPTYGPTVFAKAPGGRRKSSYEAAMSRLFTGHKIKVENYGRPSRPYTRLVEA